MLHLGEEQRAALSLLCLLTSRHNGPEEKNNNTQQDGKRKKCSRAQDDHVFVELNCSGGKKSIKISKVRKDNSVILVCLCFSF